VSASRSHQSRLGGPIWKKFKNLLKSILNVPAGDPGAAAAWVGAAVTCARRYALFTLVRITGEDDLDAPNLNQSVEAISKRDAAKDSVASSIGKAETAELERAEAKTNADDSRSHDPFPTAKCNVGTAGPVVGRVHLSRPTLSVGESACNATG
jgi:hypothetical protein